MERLNIGFPVYSYKNKPKEFNVKVENLVAARTKLYQQQNKIETVKHYIECTGNQINMLINNIFAFKKPFDYKKNFLFLDMGYTAVCNIADLENISFQMSLQYNEITEDMLMQEIPKTIYKQTFNLRQYNLFLKLSEMYNKQADILQNLISEFKSIEQTYDMYINSFITDFLEMKMQNYGAGPNKAESFNDSEHDIVLIKVSEKRYCVFYLRKEYKNKFVNYMNQKLNKKADRK